MTVIQPNSISGINSITVQSGEGLSVHKSDGSLIREIVSATGVGTFYALNVGSATTVSNAGDVAISGITTANGGVKVGAAISLHSNGNLGITGIMTASSYVGDGSALTGIAGTEITDSDFAVGVSTFFVDYSTSNVGINTVVPTAALDVTGDVNVTGVCTAAAFVPSEGQLSNRNIIINGAMNVAQRATSSTDNSYATVDRFRTIRGGTDEAPTQAQVALTSSDAGPWEKGFRSCLKVTNGNQTSGAGANDSIAIQQKVEAQNLASSGWNYNSTSSYITLSFWCKSSVAQNFYGRLETPDGTAQNYPFETGSLTADTWTYVTKKIPGFSNIQIDNNTGTGMEVEWMMFRGTDQTGSISLDTWAAYAGGTRSPDQTSTWYTTNDATFQLTGVQLEVGSYATPFEHRSYADELRRCQRYFQHHMSKENEGATFATRFTTQAQGGITYYTALRAAPTHTLKGVNIHVMSDGGNIDVTSMNMTIGGTNVTTQTSLVALITAGSLDQGDACLAHGNSGDDPMGIWLDSEL